MLLDPREAIRTFKKNTSKKKKKRLKKTELYDVLKRLLETVLKKKMEFLYLLVAQRAILNRWSVMLPVMRYRDRGVYRDT